MLRRLIILLLIVVDLQSTMSVKTNNIDPHQEFILEIVIILHRQELG